jgi:hypothetical protein
MHIQIWDAGAEALSSTGSVFYREIQAVLFVFDLTSIAVRMVAKARLLHVGYYM